MRKSVHPAASRHHPVPATSVLSQAIGQALRTPRVRRRASALMTLAALALAAPVAQAQSTEWIGTPGITQVWENNSNWTANVPVATVDAFVRNGGNARVTSGSARSRDLTVASGSTVFIGTGAGLTTSRGALLDGGRVELDGGSWNVGGMIVGFLGTDAAVAVSNGGMLSSDPIVIGFHAGSTGSVSVDGAGSTLNAGTVTVGESGTGTLDVGNGASVDVNNLFLGRNAGSIGQVTVDGAGTTLNSDNPIVVGEFGDGRLTISGGADVESGLDSHVLDEAGIQIGVEAGSTGIVTVTGTGSTLTMANNAVIGYDGHGRLEVLDGGSVTNFAGLIGAFSSAGRGEVLVQGDGSTWTSNSTLIVGYHGDGSLEIADGGTVNSLFDAFVGYESGTTGAVSVHGAGASWNSTAGIVVGQNGSGSLSVSNGGVVSAGGISIGTHFSDVAEMEVEGAGSQVDAAFVGVGGINGASLEIRDGGVVNSGVGGVGDWVFASGVYFDTSGTALIEGAGSRWNVAGDFFVGINDGTVTVRDGGVLATGNAWVGNWYSERLDAVPGDNAWVLVDGAGSAWDSSGTITVGVDDNGLLTVQNGGTVTSAGGVIGANQPTDTIRSDGEVVVDGAGSSWTNSGFLSVGREGTGTLTVRNGATVDGGSTVAIGQLAGGLGTVDVSGVGSTFAGGDVIVGAEGTGTLTIRNGAAVDNAFGFVGIDAGGHGTVNVDGAGSTWTNDGSLLIGGAGGTGTVNIVNGGWMRSSDTPIGADAGGHGVLRVSGAGSHWENLAAALVGYLGDGELVIENGGTASSAQAFLGVNAGTHGTARVDGAGSAWTIADALVVGDRGSAELTVSDGGTVTATELMLAESGGSTGTINIGTGGASGTLDTARIAGGAGTATVNFNHSDDVVFDILLTGSLAVNKLGDGTTTFLADNDYTGLTTISAGILQLGDGGTTGGVAGDIANDALLVFNRSNTYDYLGAIGGSGDVHKLGSGTLMLSGFSTYDGATRVQSGTLLVEGSLGDTATTVFAGATLGGNGSIAGDVTVNDGATLAPGGSGAGTLTVGSLALSSGSILDYDLGQAGVIGSGINDLIEIDGDLTLDGTLDITDAGGFGAGVYRLMNYGGDIIDNGLDVGALPSGFTSDDLFVQTAIVGQVNLINSAGVSLNFWDGAAGPAHDGIIQGGDGVWVGNDTSWTDADGALNGNWNEGFAVFGGAAGTVTVIGEQAFTGMQFMTDGYRLEQGTDGALRADGATNLRVDPNVTATIAAPIVGDATLVKVDEGTLVLEGDFGYTGGVVVNGGRLVGDTGNLLGSILNRAELEFAQADDDAYANAISGDGALIKSADGTLVLTGANTYTGGTTVEAGTLQVGDGGTSGSIVGDVEIQTDAALVFDRSDSVSFAGAFSGDGTLDKFGAGTLLLTGDSSAYAGQATLHTGGLQVDGTLGGFLDVLAGATLSGRGTLGSVDNAGTVSPDGTLSFTGDYVHRDGATYTVDIAPDGTGDLLDIVGSATIEGGEVFVIKAPGQYAGGSRYTIVDADGGVVGTFDTLDQNLPFLDLILSYDPNHVYLDILRNDTEFGSLCGTGTFNQCEVAKTLDSFDPEVPPTADIGEMVEQVTGMDTQTALAAFDRMSGEVHPSLAGIVLEGHALYGQTVTRRMVERREALGADRLHGGAWVRGYGASSELDGDGNAHAADWDLRGLAVGFDTWGTEHWLIGASANFMQLDADFRAGDRGEVDAKNLALYTSFQGERAYLDAVASYAWWDNDTTRAVEVGDIDRTATASYNSHRFATYVEGGWTFNVGERSLLQPMLSLQYDNLASQAFREDGAQDLSLIGRSDSVERLTLGAGARWSTTFNRGDWTLEPTVQARWLHSEGDEYAEFDVAFSGAPDEGYRLPEFGWRVRGVTLPQDRGVVGLGLAARNDNLDLFVDYDFQAGDGFKAHNLGAGLRYRW